MTELKVQYVPTLLFLLSKGAKSNYVPITTQSLGRQIKKSQQAVSKHLLELERQGFIKRIINGRTMSVNVTNSGYLEVIRLYKTIQSSLKESHSDIKLKGILTSGMGEGAYYMGLDGYTKQFKAKIGYIPFPGTFNVKLVEQEFIEAAKQFYVLDGIMIDRFSDGERTFGWVKCFPARLNDDIDCHLIILERTHHDLSIIELISKSNIRLGGLKDGSSITITVSLQEDKLSLV